MPLETSIICLDTSEWMRNGDYTPTRLAAEYDVVATMCACKVNQNPENTVGLIAYSGKGVRLLTAPTDDQGKLYAVLGDLKPEGGAAVTLAIKTAMLAMKHRKNKNGGQRIVVFAGSPVDAKPEELKALGALLRRNNIGIDVVGIGENEANLPAFTALVEATNKEGNSRLLMVPPGILPSEMLAASPIMMGDAAGVAGGAGAGAGAGAAAGGAGGAAGRGGFPGMGGDDVDPELAEAIRQSLELERQSQARADAPSSAAGGAAGTAAAAGLMSIDGSALTEEEQLAQALAMSMEMNDGAGAAAAAPAVAGSPATPAGGAAPATPAAAGGAGAPVAPGAPAHAAAAPSSAASAGSGSAATPAAAGGFENPEFISSVLQGMEGLEGVDMSDPEIMAAIAAAMGGSGTGPAPGAGGSGGSGSSSGGGSGSGSGNA